MTCWLALLSLASATRAAATEPWPFPWPESRIARYTAHRAPGPIAVDGRLDEPDWKTAPRSPRFSDLVRGEPGIHDTRAAVLWDDEHLYVGYWVEEPFVFGTLTERDSLIYKNNDVEFFIAGQDAYYEFEINCPRHDLRGLLHLGGGLRQGRVRGHPGVRSRAGRRPALPRRRLQEPPSRPAHRVLEVGPPRPAERRARGRHGERQLGPGSRLDGGDRDSLAGSRALARPDGRALPPRDGDTWRMDFSRFNQYKEAPPAKDPGGWAWSPHGAWDSHIPEVFPFIRFSTRPTGEAAASPWPRATPPASRP